MPANSVLYDIGACVGSYALIAAHLGHNVVAFEPSFANYARLCENVILNDLGHKVIALCVALGNVPGPAVMQQEVVPGYSGGSKKMLTQQLPLALIVQTFGLPQPTHIKLDVDGGEVLVLQGAGPLPLLQGLMLEVSTRNLRAVEETMVNGGFQRVATHTQRKGEPIKGIKYEEWVKAG